MRHGKKINHLSRTDSHRKALLSSLATSLIVHKRITTTVAKAKALRTYVEPLLTKSKLDSTHSRRMVFSYLQDKNSVNILFRDIAVKIAERPGGYTRIIKTGTRLGDNAEMCFIELVDYNEIYKAKTDVKKTKTTRRGRNVSGSKTKSAPVSPLESAPVIESSSIDQVEEIAHDESPMVVDSEISEASHETEASEPLGVKPETENLSESTENDSDKE